MGSKFASKLPKAIIATNLVMTDKVKTVIGCFFCYPILNLADTLPVHAFRAREFSFDEKYVYRSKAEIFWCQKSRVSETYKRHLLESWPVTEMIQLFTVSHILHSKINCIISIFMLFKNFIILELCRFLTFHEFFFDFGSEIQIDWF